MKILWGSPVKRPTALLLWKRRISQRLKTLLEREEMSLPELSLRSGLPTEFLERILKAKFYPPHKARSKMAKALRTTVKYLES